MRNVLLTPAVFLLSVFIFSHSFAQSITPTQQAYNYLLDHYGIDQKAIGDLKIKDHYRTDHNGVEHYHFCQVVNGFDVFGSHFNLAVQTTGKVSASGHSLHILKDVRVSNSKASIDAPAAIGIVAGSLGIASRSFPTVTRTLASGVPVYTKADISHQDIPAELGYIMKAGELILTWKLQIESTKNGNLYESFVNANNGKLIANDQLTLHCSFEKGFLQPSTNCDSPHAPFIQAPPPVNAVGSYRVLPLGTESPNHGSFELVTGKDDVLASPFGWHDNNGVAGNDFTYTRGNNVHAFLDRNWDYVPDGELDGGASLLFDFPYDPSTEPSANQNVALTNLFYWNNVMHDFAFRYGFNEVAGNFQDRNYSGQAANQDYVEAHSQFGDMDVDMCGQQANGGMACLNNADFSTPSDGFNGRMRMFTWNL
ncbi:MAG: extracellular metalloproteinase, partial [Bacteroidota bacterium]|nr:extracellular metalloproteinase [Bacteroidota bacterium]